MCISVGSKTIKYDIQAINTKNNLPGGDGGK